MDTEIENTFLVGLEEHKQKLLRICTVYATDEEERNDFFQEALMNIWKSMPSFKSDASIGTWMYRITLNVCLNMQTRLTKKNKQVVNLDSLELSKMDSHSDLEEENPLLPYLRACLKSLNEADKAVMALYLEELPYKEISAVTGLSANHVAVKIKRIKTKLLNCINKKS